MINRAIVAGRLCKDVELRYTPNGKANTKVTIACNREFKNANGEREADFINVECWSKTAELLANHFKKGDIVGFEGAIRTGSYEGQDGKRVYTTNVNADKLIFIQGNNRNEQQQSGGSYGGGQASYGGQPTPQYNTPPQGAANQPQQQYSEEQVQAYLRQQQQQQQQQQQMQDPFANSKGPIEVSSDDLPF